MGSFLTNALPQALIHFNMAKITTFIKPTISLPVLPAVNMALRIRYSEIETRADYVAFINYCFTAAETSSNEIKSQAYHNLASALYSFETNISYESKKVELLVASL